MFLIAVAAVLCFSSFANGVAYTNCGSPYATIYSVDVTGCDPSQPNVCTLRRGQNATIAIDWTINKPATELNVKVWGVVLGFPFPFTMPYPNGCDDPNRQYTCPLTSGTRFIYTATVEISSSYPPASATVKLQLSDEKTTVMLCISFPVQIV